MSLSIEYAGLTDAGRIREENQDRWCADRNQQLFVVADGMGGTMQGGLASRVVIETLPLLLEQRLENCDDVPAESAIALVTDALNELSNRLHSESHGQLGLEGMGSTVVLCLVREEMALIGHLGDSRSYLLRDSSLRQLTKDHTIVQLLIDEGEITPEEASEHPSQGQLTRYVGMESDPMPDVLCTELQPGDRLLLCTDGLTGMVDDDRIRELLAADSPVAEICRQLTDAANAAGGKDNIATLVISISVVEDDRTADDKSVVDSR